MKSHKGKRFYIVQVIDNRKDVVMLRYPFTNKKDAIRLAKHYKEIEWVSLCRVNIITAAVDGYLGRWK